MKQVISLFLVSLCLSSVLYAGESHGGKVVSLMVHQGDVVIFDVGQHSNRPDCSVIGNQWALSLQTDTGKSMYALLLSAAAQGQVVYVKGTGTCNAWGDRESPSYMWVGY